MPGVPDDNTLSDIGVGLIRHCDITGVHIEEALLERLFSDKSLFSASSNIITLTIASIKILVHPVTDEPDVIANKGKKVTSSLAIM